MTSLVFISSNAFSSVTHEEPIINTDEKQHSSVSIDAVRVSIWKQNRTGVAVTARRGDS